ncbi:hypothetical protein P170DRAFT_512601 [Aspergillus steynii IBT 23096]|uniref:Prion-inhibition and propagation HeLo domain-containing protein n=1 Tax=Aspergillus steynii IBT 23096 TaxID=1392250 RepID=A0A2I2FZF0_9EURO|nr:uncharacterized protein P170DRAFT_512601 [Aspergillus steynii IBT 23096]PLB46002.1 hypothetical protein P170DRAFT_512601 [Aspergillus steynii IBT 23096]
MAEAFGIVSGAVGIAGIFTTCLECFDYIQLGRRFGQDFQTNQLVLSGLKLRLSRWGEAVHLYTDPQLGHPTASEADLQLAKNTLYQILVLMADSEKVSKKFDITARPGDDLSDSTNNHRMTANVAAMDDLMRKQAARRQKGTSLVKITSWALHDKEHFSGLIENIAKLLDGLEQMFPAPEAQKSLAESEIREVCNGIQDQQGVTLKLIQDLSNGVDGVLKNQASTMIEKGITVGSLVATDNSRVRDGSFYGSAWKGETQVPVSYSRVAIDTIHAEGHSRVMNGHTYADQDNFWN